MPELSAFGSASDEPAPPPGAYETLPGNLTLNAGREAIDLPVTNLGDRPVQVGSHYHFIETNARSGSTAPEPTAAASTSPPAPPSASSRARRRPSASSKSPATKSSAAATTSPTAPSAKRAGKPPREGRHGKDFSDEASDPTPRAS